MKIHMKLTKEAFQNLSHLKLHREGKEEEGGRFFLPVDKKKKFMQKDPNVEQEVP